MENRTTIIRQVLSLIFSLIAGYASILHAQLPPHTFTQYSSEDGLLQKKVQNILQDSKGMMWFATWDGLYQFDGINFKSHKSHPGDGVQLNNNRMDNLSEDAYGYLWMQSYDGNVVRFNPANEQFEALSGSIAPQEKLFVIPHGDVWVTTADNKLLQVTTDSANHHLQVTDFFAKHKTINTSKVMQVCADKQRRIWLLTTQGLYSYAQQRLERHQIPYTDTHTAFYAMDATDSTTCHFGATQGKLVSYANGIFHTHQLPTRSSVKTVVSIDADHLFVGTSSDGFFVVDTRNYETRHYHKGVCPALPNNHIEEIYIDHQRHCWIRTDGAGVTLFNPESGKAKYHVLYDKYGLPITDSRPDMYILEDLNGILWIHPSGGGLAWYNPKEEALVPFYNPQLQTGWSYTDRITGIYSDRQGNLWYGSYEGGLQKVSFNDSHFSLFSPKPQDADYPGNNVRALFEDSKGQIWMGSKDNRIRIYNHKMQPLGILGADGSISPENRDELGMAYAFAEDNHGTLWIGTKGNGLLAATPQSSQHYKINRYKHSPRHRYSLNGNNIYSLYIDSHQRLWIGTFDGGINYLDLNRHMADGSGDGHFIHAKNELLKYPLSQCYRTRVITSDGNGSLWIGTTMGLLRCRENFADPRELEFGHYTRQVHDVSSLSNNDVHCIHFKQDGNMYVGTFGGGLNVVRQQSGSRITFKSYSQKDGLPSDIIYSLAEDREGNLWLSTEEELCRFYPDSHRFETFTRRALPQRLNFNEGNALVLKSGRLLFNTMSGVLHFSPDSIEVNGFTPPIRLTDFTLTSSTDARTSGILSSHINETGSIVLPPHERSFTLQFAALDYSYPSYINYAYRLKGFETEWNHIGHRHSATYTNLPHGNYTFEVKSTNSDGVWVNNSRQLEFKVLPTFWETPWAYLLYVMTLLLIIFTATYILFTIFRLKHKVNIEQEIADIKLRFFTNISHELRTPLTLIIGLIEQLLKKDNLEPDVKEQLTLVERNNRRMLRLVNQILDFRKVQNNKMRLHVQQIELVCFVRHLMENFDTLAQEHRIDFRLTTEAESLMLWADNDKLEKIVFNLLSNAFKYTPEGKAISVGISCHHHNEVCISITDQGIGIAPDKQQTIFERFGNLADRNLFNNASTGIGLSLTKELVELHHGSIELQSRENEGSTFSVHLPLGKEHFGTDTEFIVNDGITSDDGEVSASPGSTLTDTAPAPDTAPTLLIAEDNDELRGFLCSIFRTTFRIVEAKNGREGLAQSANCQPDLIISDVMMPEMDGIAMTTALRQEVNTSHIPIILLTAKTSIESQIEGLERGADDYITKPFSATYLQARVKNLLEQRRKLQALYRSALQLNQPQDREQLPQLAEVDREFLAKVMQIIHDNIDNGGLRMEDIGSAVNMSRSVYFKKIKTLTGLSPVEFLRDIRMRRAAELIDEGKYTMAEIAYMVGINDPHYFSKCFKQHFSMTPTEYKERGKR